MRSTYRTSHEPLYVTLAAREYLRQRWQTGCRHAGKNPFKDDCASSQASATASAAVLIRCQNMLSWYGCSTVVLTKRSDAPWEIFHTLILSDVIGTMCARATVAKKTRNVGQRLHGLGSGCEYICKALGNGTCRLHIRTEVCAHWSWALRWSQNTSSQ